MADVDLNGLHAKLEMRLAEEERKSGAAQAEDKAAVSALRDTAKWIIGGVALASGGVIAGSSLTGLGSLGLDWRLLVAVGGAAVGFTALAILLSLAIEVITPRTYDLHAIVIRGETISARDLDIILVKVQASMPAGLPSIREMVCLDVKLSEKAVSANSEVTDALYDKRVNLNIYLRNATSSIRFEHSRMMFDALTKRLFMTAPVIALSFGVFAWAANPPKDNPADVAPMVKDVDVHPNDVAALRKAMAAPACLDTKLSVVVLREWRSGSQEVVTVPKGSCPPIRLRLDNGRLSPVG